MLNIKTKNDGVLFKVHVQPKASSNAIAGLHGDALKIRLTAPPADNAANKMCVAFLSKILDVSKSSIEIVSGHTSRSKKIFVRFADDSPHADKAKMIIRKINKWISPKKS